MDHLCDTNILGRTFQYEDPSYEELMLALHRITRLGHRLCILPQGLIELWNVCTRPLVNNGFGLSVEATRDRIDELEFTFHLLPNPPGVYWEWRRLVEAHRVMGKQVHDARLVAAIRILGIRHILTLTSGISFATRT